MFASFLSSVTDALAWGADNLLAPALTGVFVGLALRYAAIRREVNEHGALAEELNTDLLRWIGDRERGLVAEIWRGVNLAQQGVIEDVEPAWVPPELEGTKPGSQADSGAFVGRVERLMHAALHEYRDQASQTVRRYRAMARSEGRLHSYMPSRRRMGVPSPLRLSAHARDTLATWRERPVPVMSAPTATVADDPTRQDDAADIGPLEGSGLTWADAGTAAPAR